MKFINVKKSMKKISLLILILISWTNPASSQSNLLDDRGIPFITNWSPKDYGEHKQNWAIAQDDRGVMYFGNGEGVLEYDGVSWRLISLPGQKWVYSLAIDQTGKIYVGSDNELGYLMPDSSGKLQYISLMSDIPEEYRDFGEVWQTLATNNEIYFGSPKYLFRLKSKTNGTQNNFRIWKAENSFHVTFLLGDKIYTRQRKIGLMELSGDSLRLVSDGEKFADDRVYVMLPFDNKILVGAWSGLYLFDGKTFQPFNTQADAFLLENQLYHGVVLKDSTFALATRRGGIVIIDGVGRLLQIVNKASGLRDETVRFLFPDREGGLWAALDNGLARMETPAPFSLYSEQLGIKGSVAGILRHHGWLYAVTSQGIYFLTPPKFAGSFSTFQPIPEITNSSWSLLSANNILLAATGDGVFRIEKDKVIQQYSDLYSFFLYHSRRDTDKVYIGLNDGLGLLLWKNGNWHFAGVIPGISGEVRSIVEDQDGTLWLGSSLQGVYRVKIPQDQIEFTGNKSIPNIEIDHYSEKDGMPLGWAEVSFIKNQVRFSTTKGLRYFDSQSQSFIPDTSFGLTIADTSSRIGYFIENKEGQLYTKRGDENETTIAVASQDKDGKYSWDITPFLRISGYSDMLAIYSDTKHPGIVWFGIDGGIVRYNQSVEKNYTLDYSVLIRRVSVKDSLIFDGEYQNSKKKVLLIPELKYSLNQLRFEFAAPYYDGQSAIKYQTFLEGFDKTWSEWTNETKKDYTNLSEGEYHFRVRAKNLYNHLSKEAVFSFKILPPIWKTWWAYVFYALILGLVIFAVDRFQRRRLVKKERERAEIRETKLRVQAAEAENKMLHLESQRKELELLKATELKTAYTELQKMHENLKATQEQLVTQQKLASLGALTAGIAHEIKNPLNFVNNFSEVSSELVEEIKELLHKENNKEGLEIAEDLKQNLDKINQHGKRADSIVKGMLLHSRGTSGEKTLTDINDLLDQDVNLAYHGMRATNKEFNITIEKDYDKTLEKINVVPQDISRVFLNIINNACYAAYDRKKKSSNDFNPILKVSTKNLNGKVEIKIGDNGNGIPENILDKIFQPFFTTKPTGEGTGLGLSLSYDVVTKVHGGELKVETKESEGTEFIITLPKQNEA
jgi:signal transduction histidine kinase/ligand-binding sensor domain-containing protein